MVSQTKVKLNKLYQQATMPDFEIDTGEIEQPCVSTISLANPVVQRDITPNRTTSSNRYKGWPSGLPAATGYINYHFHCYQPQKNVYRDYHLEYSSSLWGQHVVARRWGRRGGKERCAEREFTSQAEAVEYLRCQIVKRVKREYTLVSAI